MIVEREIKNNWILMFCPPHKISSGREGGDTERKREKKKKEKKKKKKKNKKKKSSKKKMTVLQGQKLARIWEIATAGGFWRMS